MIGLSFRPIQEWEVLNGGGGGGGERQTGGDINFALINDS